MTKIIQNTPVSVHCKNKKKALGEALGGRFLQLPSQQEQEK